MDITTTEATIGINGRIITEARIYDLAADIHGSTSQDEFNDAVRALAQAIGVGVVLNGVIKPTSQIDAFANMVEAFANVGQWTFIARNETHVTIECKRCGALRDIKRLSLTPNVHIVCSTCEARR